MYNKKSRVSAILALATAVLFIVLMSAFYPIINTSKGRDIGAVLALLIFGQYGTIIFYSGAGATTLVTAICGLVMLFAKSRKRLISCNRSVKLWLAVLLIPTAVGLFFVGYFFYMFKLSEYIVLVVLALAAYLACIVVSFITSARLKRMPAESETAPPAEDSTDSQIDITENK